MGEIRKIDMRCPVRCPSCGNGHRFSEILADVKVRHIFSWNNGFWDTDSDEIVEVKGSRSLLCTECGCDVSDQLDAFDNG